MRRFITTTLAAVAAAAVLALPAAHAATTPTTTATPATTTAAATAADDPVPGKLLLMLDASGSMKAKDPSGLTKIEAAKKSLTSVVIALPDTAQVGLRVYGAKVDGKGKPTPAACADTELVQPVGPLDKTGLTTTISAIKALGETPIAHSLEEAMKDLGSDGKRNIVLVSDGEESCVPDPCPAVKKLTGAGIDLQIDTVGFGVNTTARTQLQCIADAGNGTYYDAKNADQLTTSLSKLSQRALRPFTVSGTPIKGAFETEGSGPELLPGQYVDTFGGQGRETPRSTGGFETTLNYRIKRTVAGSTPRISVTARPPGVDASVALEGWRLSVRTDSGRECVSSSELARSENRNRQIVSASAALTPKDPTGQSTSTDECMTEMTLLLTAVRSGSGGEVPAEIRYIEEPPVTNLDSLPAAVQKVDPKATSPATGTATTVVGGASFSDSQRLAPGTYVTSIVPGEETFFRVPIDWGQNAVVSVDGPNEKSWYDRGLREMLHVFGHVYSPDRVKVDTWTGGDSLWIWDAENTTKSMVNVVPSVNYRNRWSKQADGFSMAGDYYVSVGMTTEHGGKALSGVSVPIRFSVAVSGTPSGEPAYAGAAPTTSASPSATADSSSSAASDTTAADSRRDDTGSGPLLWVGLGAVALLGAASAAYTIVRTRRVRN